MSGDGQAHYRAALAAACAQVGLDARDATVLHVRANAVYHLPRERVVARIRFAPAGPDAVMARFTAAVRLTRWLRGQGFPATEPLDVDQPVVVDQHVATFWWYVAVMGETGRDVVTLGEMLRRLHELGPPVVLLPGASLLGSLRSDLRGSSAVAAGDRDWLLARASELEDQYQRARWVLGSGLVHGDAHAGNLLPAPRGMVLGDWDSVCRGPRELDLVPTSMWYRYGRPRGEWDRFCAAYRVDPGGLPGLALLRQLRELHALAAYVRNAADPVFGAELARRIASLRTGDRAVPWRAL